MTRKIGGMKIHNKHRERNVYIYDWFNRLRGEKIKPNECMETIFFSEYNSHPITGWQLEKTMIERIIRCRELRD